MPIYLKQSTASQEIPLGYFVDSTDGNTEETGLTIANTDIKLWKTGATTLASKNSGGATHISNGVYYCTLDATDTGTLGSMIVFVHVSGALACKVECVVLAANVYDSLIGGGFVNVSGLDQILASISGLKNDVSGLPGILSTISGLANNVSGIPSLITNTSNILWNLSGVCKNVDVSGHLKLADVSALAGIVTNTSNILWNLSGVAHQLDTSGNNNILSAISGLKNDVSGLPGILTAVSGTAIAASGNDKILSAISGLKTDVSAIPGILTAVSTTPSGVANYDTSDAASLTANTIASDMRMGRWYNWKNMYIDKTYNPNRMYFFDGTNYSSYFTITDDSNSTQKVKGN